MNDHQFFRLLANLIQGLRSKMTQKDRVSADVLLDECLKRAGEQKIPFNQ
jgi:hypothetical protein